MAYERDKSEWARASAIMAQLANVNRGKDTKPIPADAYTPYSSDQASDGSSKIKLNAKNLHLLKALTGKRR